MSVIENFLKHNRFDEIKIFGFCVDCGEIMRMCGTEYENGWEVSRVCHNPDCGFSFGENSELYREGIGPGKLLRVVWGSKWIGGMPSRALVTFKR